MDFTAVLKIASVIIVSLGGAGAIIVALTNFIANKIAKRLEDKYQLKLDKELEKYKATLERRTYVTKNQFDLELETYRKITRGVFEFTVALNTTIEKKDYPRNEGKSPDKKIEEESYIYHKMIIKASNLQELLYANAAFIPKQLYNECKELIELVTDQFWIYIERFRSYVSGDITQEQRVTNADKEAFDAIQKKFDIFNDHCVLSKHINL